VDVIANRRHALFSLGKAPGGGQPGYLRREVESVERGLVCRNLRQGGVGWSCLLARVGCGLDSHARAKSAHRGLASGGGEINRGRRKPRVILAQRSMRYTINFFEKSREGRGYGFEVASAWGGNEIDRVSRNGEGAVGGVSSPFSVARRWMEAAWPPPGVTIFRWPTRLAAVPIVIKEYVAPGQAKRGISPARHGIAAS